MHRDPYEVEDFYVIADDFTFGSGKRSRILRTISEGKAAASADCISEQKAEATNRVHVCSATSQQDARENELLSDCVVQVESLAKTQSLSIGNGRSQTRANATDAF